MFYRPKPRFSLITDLERLTDPIFVGEASSECCNFYGNPSVITLPYSRVRGALTGVKWNFSSSVFDGRREMSPEVPVQLTAHAYFAGEDPALDATLRMISGPQPRPRQSSLGVVPHDN